MEGESEKYKRKNMMMVKKYADNIEYTKARCKNNSTAIEMRVKIGPKEKFVCMHV